MLTPAEEDRLEEALPSQVTIEYQTEDGTIEQTYQLSRHWTGPDQQGADASASPEYPTIIFDWDVRGEPADERQPADNVLRIESDDDQKDEPKYREIRTTEQYSDLVIQVAVRARHDQAIPPDVRLTQLARSVWDVCDEHLDQDGELNEAGQNGERAMAVDVLSGLESESRTDRTLRTQWRIRLRYRKETTTEYDTVEEIDHEVDLESPAN